MNGKLRVVLVIIVIGVLLLPSLVLAQDTTGEHCVIIQKPFRTESGFGIMGPVVTVGGMLDIQVVGPQILFTENSNGPVVLLPAVQAPPNPC